MKTYYIKNSEGITKSTETDINNLMEMKGVDIYENVRSKENTDNSFMARRVISIDYNGKVTLIKKESPVKFTVTKKYEIME